jgi:hypothetical protein
VKKGDGTTTADSLPLVLDLAERAETPTGVQGVNETVSGQNDGKITGVTEDMEYRTDGGDTWTTCLDGEITGLKPGDYEVRVAAISGDTPENSSFASLPFSVTVSAGAPPAPQTYPATVNNGTGGGSFAEGATVTITANAPENGKVFDTWTGDNGVSFGDATKESTSFVMPANAVTVTATYKEDVKDSDGDGVPDYVEVKDGTDPNDACDFKDTDGDGVPDYVETKDGTDPNDKSSFKDVNGNGIPDYVEDHPAPVLEINGWVYADGVWKYFVDSVAKTGWFYDTNYRAWYLLDYSDGHMLVGWQYDKNYKAWFYLTGNGAMKTGWLYDKDYKSWFYLIGDGSMKVGWFYDDNYKAWFYFIGDGAMKVNNWVEYKGSWYYLSGNGTMLTGKRSIGGAAYTFKSNGAWIS